MGDAPWQTLGREGTVQLSTEWQAYRLVVQPGSGAENARLVFDPPMQTGRIWLAGISLRPGGVTGLPAGETLQAGTVAGLPHDKLADRSSSATARLGTIPVGDRRRLLADALPLPEGRAEGAGSGDRHHRRLQHAEPDGQVGLH